MIGIVGKVKISYEADKKHYEECYDLNSMEKIVLAGANMVEFRVEQINYIEDTVYEATLSMLQPVQKLNEYSIGMEKVRFDIPEYEISGTLELAFLN